MANFGTPGAYGFASAILGRMIFSTPVAFRCIVLPYMRCVSRRGGGRGRRRLFHTPLFRFVTEIAWIIAARFAFGKIEAGSIRGTTRLLF